MEIPNNLFNHEALAAVLRALYDEDLSFLDLPVEGIIRIILIRKVLLKVTRSTQLVVIL